MGEIMASVFGSIAERSADQTLGLSAIATAAVNAQAYLAAALDSATPEVRRLFSEYSTQAVLAQEAALALAVTRGWLDPYRDTLAQLQVSVSESTSVLDLQ
jgi:spore coat protein CotF